MTHKIKIFIQNWPPEGFIFAQFRINKVVSGLLLNYFGVVKEMVRNCFLPSGCIFNLKNSLINQKIEVSGHFLL